MTQRQPASQRTPALARSVLLTLGLLATASGCGFQLRGAAPVSAALQPLALQCASDVPINLCQSVRQQLTLGDVDLRETNAADYILVVGQYTEDRRASAITINAGAAEYTLRQSVSINLISRDKVPLIADTRLNASESYRYDETNVLAKQREEKTLQKQLQERLAQQIIFRLAPLTQARIDALREQYQDATGNPVESPEAGTEPAAKAPVPAP
ncbi:LPS assembly lipoprotein LptE [Marinobacter sp. ELB17]|uniref:LPS-assembly lipoprotein LptE n=1 Tax=Marinobacter sp. ELB17 TaxID=270374 RepID=UPI0000F36B13|nr:LPS assembly lipoprotein LptE [Marinobacter sp. ELB17]EAZ99311.1 Rare lipoprotein B [Marinobacter sp. ELB17]